MLIYREQSKRTYLLELRKTKFQCRCDTAINKSESLPSDMRISTMRCVNISQQYAQMRNEYFTLSIHIHKLDDTLSRMKWNHSEDST